MKKYFRLLGLIIIVTLVTGCDNNKGVTKKCTLNTNSETQGYELNAEYIIQGKGKVVENVVTTETITSDEEEVLNYFEQYLNDTYTSANNKYGGYEYSVTKDNGKVISKTTIDYSKMNLEQYITDNSAMKDYVNSKNQILVDGVVKIYESLGAKCE